MTADTIKAFLSSPAALFVMMLIASGANGLKQVLVVRQTSAPKPMTFRDYWSHLPETISTIVSNAIAFALLLMADQLNFASAIGIGYGVNSLSDLITRGGRSYALKSIPDDPNKPPPAPPG